MIVPRIARSAASIALAAACVVAVAPRAEARPILSGILPEHAIFPGSPGSYTFFSGGDAPLIDAQRLRLKGPVTSVTISVDANGAETAGDPQWESQGPPALLFLNEHSDLKEVNVGASENSPGVRMLGEHDYSGEGDARRRTAARIKVIVADAEREFNTQTFTYDDKGRLSKVASLTPGQPEATETFEYAPSGGVSSYRRIDPTQTSSFSSFNAAGRITEQTWLDGATGAPVDGSKRTAAWTGDTVLISDGSDQPCESCGEFTFDDKGSLVKWHLSRGSSLFVLRNAFSYDAKGNWTSLTTSLLDNPVDEKSVRPLIRYTRTITYVGDPLPVIPAPAAAPAPKSDDAKAPETAPPAKKD